MWTLIIMLGIDAATSVPGFESEQACETAAVAVEQRMAEWNQRAPAVTVCVRMTDEETDSVVSSSDGP